MPLIRLPIGWVLVLPAGLKIGMFTSRRYTAMLNEKTTNDASYSVALLGSASYSGSAETKWCSMVRDGAVLGSFASPAWRV